MLDVDFLARLRGTEHFASAADLVLQMSRDVEQVEALIRSQ
jgi:FAD synthase